MADDDSLFGVVFSHCPKQHSIEAAGEKTAVVGLYPTVEPAEQAVRKRSRAA
jgi:hypothetical protein